MGFVVFGEELVGEFIVKREDCESVAWKRMLGR